MKEKVLVQYLRLSVEDEREGESGSIANQRRLLEDFIQEHGELEEYRIMELTDDGYTGTNFNRPAAKRLLTMVKKREVDCVLVKDFSRFSRDYIELGNYLEQVFPFLGVRFISVNDGYDSQRGEAVQSSLEIPFLGILYDLYSKDISRKQKSSKEQYRKRGCLSGGSYPFGYRKVTEGRKQTYEIDESAADTVRLIFERTLQGAGEAELARELNESGVQTPAACKRKRGEWGYGLKEGGMSVWDPSKIHRILSEERYTGTLVLGQYRSAGIGTGRRTRRPEEEWIRIPNHHPAIVTKEQFVSIRERRNAVGKGKRKSRECHLFFHRISCGCCGRYLYRKESGRKKGEYRFYCRKPYRDGAVPCFSGKIGEQDLIKLLLLILNLQAGLAGDFFFMEAFSELEDVRQEYLSKQLGMLYDRYRLGELEEEQFLEEKEKQNREKHRKENREREGTENGRDLRQLDRPLVELILDSIMVFDENRIRIRLKFSGLP